MPLYVIAQNEDCKFMKLVLEETNDYADVDEETDDEKGRTALLWAIMECDEGMVKLLLNPPRMLDGRTRKGADPNIPDKKAFFPLWVAAQDGLTEVAELLLKHGADVNQRIEDDEVGRTTPLFTAVIEGHSDMVKLLLGYKADPNIPESRDNLTPYTLASMLELKEITKMLFLAGAMEVGTCMICPSAEA